MLSVLREELSLKKIGLGFHMPEAFCQAQWQWPKLVFVVYRIVMSAYSIFAFTDNVVESTSSSRKHNIMVFLTNWTYLLETIFFFIGAILAILYVCCPRLINAQFASHQGGNERIDLKSTKNGEKSGSAGGVHSAAYTGNLNTGSTMKPAAGSPADLEDGTKSEQFKESSAPPAMPWYIQCYWIVSNIIQVFPIIVTVVYFIALYKPEMGISRTDMNLHAINSVMVLIDMVLCARPVRLLHGVFPLVYGGVYVIFSIIYWSIDKQTNVLYENVLNWNKPGMTMAVILSLSLVGNPLLQLAVFGLFKLRLYLFQKIYGYRYL